MESNLGNVELKRNTYLVLLISLGTLANIISKFL